MAKTLYLDCFSGIAGDMTLAALIDLGADPDAIASELRRLPIDPFDMEIIPAVKRGISAKYLKLSIHGHNHSLEQHIHNDDHDESNSPAEHHHHDHDQHHHGHSHHSHAHGDHAHHHHHDHDQHGHHDHHHDHSHHSHAHADHAQHHHHDHDQHGHHDHHHHDHSHHSHAHADHAHHHHDHDQHGHHDHHHHGHSHHSHAHADHAHHHHHNHGHHSHHDHHHDHVHRKAADFIAMIEHSSLSSRVKERSIAIFRVIAEAEGRIHGMPPEQVHFHEVGAMDSIIDIIGVCIALEQLGIDKIIASPVPTGYGRMRMAHGLYPIPAPATLEILRGIPLSGLQAEGELTTPTGAGILKALVARFGPLPAMQVERIGYGAGKKDFAHPNVIRAILLEDADQTSSATIHGEQETVETIEVLEAQLDDFSGEQFGYLLDRLFAVGALDVYYTPVYMKKNRPGTLITVLARPKEAAACETVVLEETTTFGVRRNSWVRTALGRRWIEVATRYGTIRVKQALRSGTVVHASPEYEDAAEAAREHQVPLTAVYEEVIKSL